MTSSSKLVRVPALIVIMPTKASFRKKSTANNHFISRFLCVCQAISIHEGIEVPGQINTVLTSSLLALPPERRREEGTSSASGSHPQQQTRKIYLRDYYRTVSARVAILVVFPALGLAVCHLPSALIR